jgi:hypothetical protein
VLFKHRFLNGIRTGETTLAFRRWRRPSVRAGGTLKTAVGVLAIESVEPITESGITAEDAHRAGYLSRDELIAELRERTVGMLYRVKFRHAGPDPRVALRTDNVLSNADVADIRRRLGRLDRASRNGPWTEKFLSLIDEHPMGRQSRRDDEPEHRRIQSGCAKTKESWTDGEPRRWLPHLAPRAGRLENACQRIHG